MTLKHALIAITCAAAFPAVALAQPTGSLAVKPDCCTSATADGDRLAAAVALPSDASLDPAGNLLAAAVLLPSPSGMPGQGCCGAHPMTAGTDAAMNAGTCCGHAAHAAEAATEACCHELKHGGTTCGMPCCQSVIPPR